MLRVNSVFLKKYTSIVKTAIPPALIRKPVHRLPYCSAYQKLKAKPRNRRNDSISTRSTTVENTKVPAFVAFSNSNTFQYLNLAST